MESEIGRRIRAERKAAGYQQQELAEKIGTSPSTLSQIETGRRDPTYVQLQNLKEILGVDFDLSTDSDSYRRREEEAHMPSLGEITDMIFSYPRISRLGARTVVETLRAFERVWEMEHSPDFGEE